MSLVSQCLPQAGVWSGGRKGTCVQWEEAVLRTRFSAAWKAETLHPSGTAPEVCHKTRSTGLGCNPPKLPQLFPQTYSYWAVQLALNYCSNTYLCPCLFLMELSFKPAALAQQGSPARQPEKLPSLSLSSPLEGYCARQLAVFIDVLMTFTQGLKKEKSCLC